MQKKNKVSLSVQYASGVYIQRNMSHLKLRSWVQAALLSPAEINIRFVGSDEGQALNQSYRGKNYSTNVLTFVYSEDSDDIVKADIVLCTDVLQREAKEKGITVIEHTAHLVVHGVLHAQGYNHTEDKEAAKM